MLRKLTVSACDKKMEDPHSSKSNEMGQYSFQQPHVCDTFKNCEDLSPVAFMDGNGVVMLGKVVSCDKKKWGLTAGRRLQRRLAASRASAIRWQCLGRRVSHDPVVTVEVAVWRFWSARMEWRFDGLLFKRNSKVDLGA